MCYKTNKQIPRNGYEALKIILENTVSETDRFSPKIDATTVHFRNGPSCWGPLFKGLGCIVKADVQQTGQCQLTARLVLTKLLGAIWSQQCELFLPLLESIVCPPLGYFWGPHYEKDTDCIENILTVTLRMVRGQSEWAMHKDFRNLFPTQKNIAKIEGT